MAFCLILFEIFCLLMLKFSLAALRNTLITCSLKKHKLQISRFLKPHTVGRSRKSTIINLAFLSLPAPHSTLGTMELPDVTGNFKSYAMDL